MRGFIPIVLMLLATLASCTPDEFDPYAGLSQDQIAIKNKLLGSWIEYRPCDNCYTYRFTEDDSIVQSAIDNRLILHHTFEMVGIDSLEVNRLWETEDKKMNLCKIAFIHEDTLHITNFTPTYYDVPSDGFDDIYITKIKN